jgi:hypothetical protein
MSRILQANPSPPTYSPFFAIYVLWYIYVLLTFFGILFHMSLGRSLVKLIFSQSFKYHSILNTKQITITFD